MVVLGILTVFNGNAVPCAFSPPYIKRSTSRPSSLQTMGVMGAAISGERGTTLAPCNVTVHENTTMTSIIDRLVLPTIVFAQFAGTSLWFAPNAVISLVGFNESQAATLVSCVQVGFILGTFTLTCLAAADRISPPFLFCVMTLIGAALDAICIASTNFALWVVLRTLVGFSLAGVYPVGMKIAAIEYPSGLGARLGVLVGALTLGTAFPWLVRGVGDSADLPYEATIGAVSVLATVGAACMAVIMIPRQGGPGASFFRRVLACFCQRSAEKADEKDIEADEDGETPPVADNEEESQQKIDTCGSEASSTNDVEETRPNEDAGNETSEPAQEQLTGMNALRALVSDSSFRAATIGYFGHMWELYAFWAWVPNLIESHANEHNGVALGNVALTSFTTIAIGCISSTLTGVWSLYAGRNVLPGSAVTAETNLLTSLCCCLLAPAYLFMSQGVFLFYLLVWGSAVVADSAQFSSLCAMYAYPGLVGTALTLTTCIGFAITVVSIQMIGALLENRWDPGNALALLVIGPVFGLARSCKEWPLHVLLCPGRRKMEKKANSKTERADDLEH